MLIRNTRNWELKETYATPEETFFNRRRFIKGALAGLGAGLWPDFPLNFAKAADATKNFPRINPVKLNDKYKLDRNVTPEEINARYNNFYEFGSHKEIWRKASRLKLRPWTVLVEGMVNKDFEIGIDDLLVKMPLEERLYRHRCVEAWAMAVPWSGFQLSHLINYAQPEGNPKFVQFETFHNVAIAVGQRQFWYPWPYTESLTIEEAMNELSFMVTGAYGKPLVPQHGAPLRLAVPWKYGFKSIKSIVRITFTRQRTKTFWEEVHPKEYGFWANVNPAFDHPRWSQATERLLGTNKRVPTQIYNGYGEFVAGLYFGIPQNRALFM